MGGAPLLPPGALPPRAQLTLGPPGPPGGEDDGEAAERVRRVWDSVEVPARAVAVCVVGVAAQGVRIFEAGLVLPVLVAIEVPDGGWRKWAPASSPLVLRRGWGGRRC